MSNAKHKAAAELACRLSALQKRSNSVPSAVQRRGQSEHQRATQLAFAAILKHESRAFVEVPAVGPEKWPGVGEVIGE